MRKRFLVASLLASLALGHAEPLLADGLIRDGVGAISSGRGGTNLGFADNGAILLDNPGALVNIEPSGFYEANVDTVTCDLHYSDRDPNNVRGSYRPIPLPELAYIRRSEDGSFAAGIGVFAPAGFTANYHMLNPILGPQQYKTIGGLGKFLPGASIRVTDKLSVGGTFGLAVTYVELHGPYTLQSAPLTGVPTLMDMQATGVAPTGSLGMQYLWSENTTFGLCYTSQTVFHTNNGPTAADVFGIAPGPLSSTFNTKFHMTWPDSLGLGVKHDLCPHRRVAADVIWYNWSAAFNHIGLTLSDPSNPAFAGLSPIHENFPLNWHDSVSLRLGYEWEPDDESICRVGYVYHKSPVPDATLTPYLDGVLEHAFSLGYTRFFHGMMLNAAYQYSFGPERHVGTSSIVGGDFDNSTFTAQAHWASLGVLVPF